MYNPSFPALPKPEVKAPICKKENRAVPIVDPNTRKVVNEIAQKPRQNFNTNCAEFVPGSKRIERTTSHSDISQQPQPAVKVLSRSPPNYNRVYNEDSRANRGRRFSPPNRGNYNKYHVNNNRRNQHSSSYHESHQHQGSRYNQYLNNAPPKADKEVSTHPKVNQSTASSTGAIPKESPTHPGQAFNMPSQIPPFSGSAKVNRQEPIEPSAVVDPSVIAVQEPLEQAKLKKCKEVIPHEQAPADNVEELPSEIVEEKPLPTAEKAEIKVPAEIEKSIEPDVDAPLPEEEKPTQVVASSAADVPAVVFHKYSVELLHKMKNDWKGRIPEPIITHNKTLNPKPLDPDVRRFLFDKSGCYEEEKKDFTGGKRNSSFNKSNQLSKRNSGELRHNDSFQNSRHNESFQSYRNAGKENSPKNNQSQDQNANASTLNEHVKLKESTNAWKPAFLAPKVYLTDEEREVQETSKMIRSFLNKLTIDNYVTLLKEVKDFNIDTTVKLEIVVNILFEKSITEGTYSAIYAKLCKELAAINAVVEVRSADDQSKTRNSLKKCLLARCQREFEKAPQKNLLASAIIAEIKNVANVKAQAVALEKKMAKMKKDERLQFSDEIDELEEQVESYDNILDEIVKEFSKTREPLCKEDAPDETDLLKRINGLSLLVTKAIDEFEELRSFVRRRSQGLINFIGALYVNDLLTFHIMFKCVDTLFSPNDCVNEDNVESLCFLLSAIGPMIDKVNPTSLNPVMARLRVLYKEEVQLPTSRIRFRVINLIEYRESGWVLREKSIQAQLKLQTIEDSIAEHYKKMDEKDQQLAEYIAQKNAEKHNRHDDRGNNYHQGGGRQNQRGSPGRHNNYNNKNWNKNHNNRSPHRNNNNHSQRGSPPRQGGHFSGGRHNNNQVGRNFKII